MATVFIDGQAGTTGLQITERLASRSDIELIYLNNEDRKNSAKRQTCLQSADISILCLPDDAAVEAASLAQGQGRLIDASSAHRIDANWIYGLPELSSNVRATIRSASRVSNPGCYPQGFILSMRPLIENDFLSRDAQLSCHAVSGYSGGGRQMIEQHQSLDAVQSDALQQEAKHVQIYALTLAHKHVPEMQTYAGLNHKPIFSPTVAHYYKGMLVQIPLFRTLLNGATAQQIHACLSDTYANEPFVQVLPLGLHMTDNGFLDAIACNGTNKIELMVFANEDQYLLVARYDNLGKGAAGAAVQNLNLMLGIEEGTSL